MKRVSIVEKGLKWRIRSHLTPFWLTFETLLVIWGPFQHLTPFSFNYETLFVIWGPFQHLTPFSFNYETLFVIWDHFRHLTPFWRTRPPIFTLHGSFAQNDFPSTTLGQCVPITFPYILQVKSEAGRSRRSINITDHNLSGVLSSGKFSDSFNYYQ